MRIFSLIFPFLLIFALPLQAQSFDSFRMLKLLKERTLLTLPSDNVMLGQLLGAYWAISLSGCKAKDWPKGVDGAKALSYLGKAMGENPSWLAYPIYIAAPDGAAMTVAVGTLGCDDATVQTIYTQSILVLGDYRAREQEDGTAKTGLPLASESIVRLRYDYTYSVDGKYEAETLENAALAINYASNSKALLNCSYGPIQPENQTGYYAYSFWYKKIWAFSEEEILKLGHNFQAYPLPPAPLESCPASHREAEAFGKAHPVPSNGYLFKPSIAAVAAERKAHFEAEHAAREKAAREVKLKASREKGQKIKREREAKKKNQ